MVRTSGHKPLIFQFHTDTDKLRLRRNKFKYEVGWALEEDCGQIIGDEWQGTSHNYDAIDVVLSGMNRCRKVLTKWSKARFRNRNQDLILKAEELKMLEETIMQEIEWKSRE